MTKQDEAHKELTDKIATLLSEHFENWQDELGYDAVHQSVTSNLIFIAMHMWENGGIEREVMQQLMAQAMAEFTGQMDAKKKVGLN